MGAADRLQTAYAAFRRWLPLTDLGVVALGLALLTFLGYGLPRSDYVVQVVAASVVGLVALGLLVVLLGAAWVWRSSRERPGEPPPPLRFEARRGFGWGRVAPAFRWLPLVEVETRILVPRGLEVTVEGGRERIEGRHRTAGGQVRRALEIEDAFGLARVSFTRVEPRKVEVGPWTGALDSAPLLTALAPGETRPHPAGRPAGDRVEMRPYVRGDPLRLVLWKVYARSGALMVRTAERALDQEVDVLAFLVAGDGDEASAAAAWVALQRGLLGPRWRFGADGTPGSTDDLETALGAVARSRGAKSRPGSGLDACLREAARAEGTRVVLFVPCRPGAWLEPTVTAVATPALRARTTVLVAHDPDDEMSAPRRGWLTRPAGPRDASSARARGEELEQVVDAFSRVGTTVSVVDRSSGRGTTGRARGGRQVA